MIDPEPRARFHAGRYIRGFLTATPGDAKGISAEEMLLFGVFLTAALFIGEDDLGMGRGTGQLFALAVGLLLSVAAKYTVKMIRRSYPGFLSRGSVDVPASKVRLVAGVVARAVVGLFMLALGLCIVGFLIALPPFGLAAFINPPWLGVVLGLPLSPLMVWGYLKITGDPAPRSTPPVRASALEIGGDPTVYEVRYGWTPMFLMQVGIALCFIAVGGVMWIDARLLAVGVFAVFGTLLGYLLMGAFLRNVAIRVDSDGVILRADPVRGRPELVPWEDIEFVVLSDVVAGPRRIDCVGLTRRSDPAGPAAGAPLVKAASWKLDEARLAKAIELNAPDVRLATLWA